MKTIDLVKKYSALVLFLFCFLSVSTTSFAESYTKTFTITAYYSPLPCQDRYVTGTLYGDKVLNGNGTNGADGTPVYAGMVAAPSAYAFGTKMHIPGVGTVAVHDRGGAILSSNGNEGVYDRLDIWMGYGDEGLIRALNWGRRTVNVTVYGLDSSISEQVNLLGYSVSESIPNDCDMDDLTVDYNTLEATVKNEAETSVREVSEPVVVETPVEEELLSNDGLLPANLSKGDSGQAVKELQKELFALNFYKGEIHGVYDDVTEHAVFKFQQASYLVADMNSLGAGIFGSKTRDALNEIISSRNYNTFIIAQANSDSRIIVDASLDSQAVVASSPVPQMSATLLSTEMDFGLVSEEVTLLQKFLKDEGYFEAGFFTDYFGPVTRDALVQFQLDKGIISSVEDLGAGRVGPSTLAFINELS